jgi:surface polysaccharide O-acyltransferase-like enzyme
MQSQNALGQTDSAGSRSVRVHYLDSLRVLAVFMVFMFHAAKPFTTGDWHVMNAQPSMLADVLFMAFLAPWGMPFFFLLAGAGTWFALQRRTARQFAGERFRRLLIPYLVGSLLFTPFQAYFEWKYLMRAEEFVGSYLQFLTVERLEGWDPSLADWAGYHLWFLADLFVLSLIALPLLGWLKGAVGRRAISRLAAICQSRGGILVFIMPLLLAQLGLRPFFPNDHSWADLCYYLVFFLSGYLFFADERFMHAIRRDRWLVLTVGIVGLLGLMAAFALGEPETWFWDPSESGFYLIWTAAPIDAWCWSLIMLLIGMRYLDFSNKWLRYGQQAILPFYVLHQPVIIVIAFYVVQWQAGVTVKMVAVIFGSLVATLGIYELLVRRVVPLRALFGMKALVKSQDTTETVQVQS